MLPFKNFLIFKMPTMYNGHKLLSGALFFLMLISCVLADGKAHTSAHTLAKQTGATQFEEERYEIHTDCNNHKHHLKKRSSDEDVDYEVYQGVVGRPGIDFPIYPRIPKTAFSCRSFGNGYFADMETDCQVFHICEEGRKISFLCPNGTIFQQSELTCDWWFKVNCLGSPGYYAESAELLNKQRLQRVRPSVPVQGFNIVGGGLNIKPKINSGAQRSSPTERNKTDRRLDSNEAPSLENVDFDDLSAEKQLKGPQGKIISNIDNNNNNDNDNESQITAESASFVEPNRRNLYAYDNTKDNAERNPNGDHRKDNGRNSYNGPKRVNNLGNGERAIARNGNKHVPEAQQVDELKERVRNGQRGQQRYREDKKEQSEPIDRHTSDESKIVVKQTDTTEKTVKFITPVEGSGRSKTSDIKADDKITPEYYAAQSTRSISKTNNVTPPQQVFPSGTYSTARRLESTRTTPYYTPTVPTIAKSKTTEGKGSYIKNQGGSGNDNIGSGVFGSVLVATTPNPNRVTSGSLAGIFGESSSAPRHTTSASRSSVSNTSPTSVTTLKPFVIGMRHYDSSAEIHRVKSKPSNGLTTALPAEKTNVKRYEAPVYLPTKAPTVAGPTYLPKSATSPKASIDAGGDALLFAPNLSLDDSVSRNVDEMIKTVNFLKEELDETAGQKYAGPAREGLEIPPSSGPDVLISLAKYFAGEQNGSNAESPNSLDLKKTGKTEKGVNSVSVKSKSSASGGVKLSDTTATLTTEASPNLSADSDDIRHSLLSDKTVNKYSNLFGLKDSTGRRQNTSPSVGLLSGVSESRDSKFKDQSALFPQIGSTDATIRQLAEKPESRKIAQVFSNALNTYLEDPTSFRAQLASVRPTEPPQIDGKPNFVPVTVTDSTLFNRGSAATYLPTKPTPSSAGTTSPSLAVEINKKFDSSTETPEPISTTDYLDTTTYRPVHNNALLQKLQLDLSGDLAPPKEDSSEIEEFLQREQTQSFVKSRNELPSGRDAAKRTHKTSTPKPTENPWNQISQADFLDPLTINVALMKETTTTPSPFTYLPKTATTTTVPDILRGNVQVLSSGSQRLQKDRSENKNIELLGINGRANVGGDGVKTFVGSAEVTTKRTDDQDSWLDIFSHYDLPRDTLPSNSGLQRIANKLFGGLNESEALHLKNVMLQAEHNRQVLGLLLLLIQTCDDQNGKALERSRKHLLNALIEMDSKLQANNGKAAHEKNNITNTPTTTARVSVTTYKRTNDESVTSTTSYPPTTTELPTSTISSTLLPGAGGSVEETTKFEIRVLDSGEENVSTISSISGSNRRSDSDAQFNSEISSDKRALELLKSLYSLASKFSSRR